MQNVSKIPFSIFYGKNVNRSVSILKDKSTQKHDQNRINKIKFGK